MKRERISGRKNWCVEVKVILSSRNISVQPGHNRRERWDKMDRLNGVLHLGELGHHLEALKLHLPSSREDESRVGRSDLSSVFTEKDLKGGRGEAASGQPQPFREERMKTGERFGG